MPNQDISNEDYAPFSSMPNVHPSVMNTRHARDLDSIVGSQIFKDTFDRGDLDDNERVVAENVQQPVEHHQFVRESGARVRVRPEAKNFDMREDTATMQAPQFHFQPQPNFSDEEGEDFGASREEGRVENMPGQFEAMKRDFGFSESQNTNTRRAVPEFKALKQPPVKDGFRD